MAERPTEKKETAKKDEEYQPLWDTDQSIPEYMTLLMDQQPSTAEDAALHQESDNEDEELEHPDPNYEYVYPGAPKRYDSAREDSDGAELDSDDLSADEPEETSKDTHESRKNDEANHPVAFAFTEPAPSPGAQTEVIGAAHAYGEYILLEHLGLSPGAILPVIPEPFFGIPDSKLIEMRLLDRSQDESAPMQACAAHLNPVKDEGNPVSRAAMIQPVGYVPVNRPPTRYSVDDLKKELTLSNIGLAALLIVNPFVLAPLASIVDPEYGFIIAFIFVVIGVGSLFVVPVLWIMGIVRTFKRRNQINDLIEEGQTPPTEYWYYLVYNRLPDGYTGINGYTKEQK